MASNVRITWNDDWKRKVDIRPTLTDIGGDIESDAKRFAPVETGELKNSIDKTVKGSGLDAALYVFATAEHANEVERGTRHMQPRPYLRPAALKRRGR